MNVDFISAIKLFFANYINFKGRSTRAEYWWVVLFTFIVSSIFSVANLVLANLVFTLAIIVPNLALTFRRFHDAGRSGWWYIGLSIASFIGVIIMYAPLFSSIITYANDPEGMSNALLQYVSAHLANFGIGLIITLAPAIWTLIILVKPSVPDNQYGPNPYGSYNA